MRGVTLSGCVVYGSLLSMSQNRDRGLFFPMSQNEAWGTRFGGGDFGFMIGSDDHAI